MFQFLRKQARSAKVRPNYSQPALEELERRDVPAMHAAPVGLAVGLGPAPLAVLAAPADPLIGPTPTGAAATQGNPKGAAGEIPAFFDGLSVTINVKQLSDTSAASIIAHNKNLNIIYVTNDLDDPQDFAPVINAVPTQGMNALWLQIKIEFNSGVTPHQFTSEADILAAAKAGEITLINTGEVYRDSVVGGQH
jgi:hypothetical protein